VPSYQVMTSMCRGALGVGGVTAAYRQGGCHTPVQKNNTWLKFLIHVQKCVAGGKNELGKFFPLFFRISSVVDLKTIDSKFVDFNLKFFL
jgi:hypothetical protein